MPQFVANPNRFDPYKNFKFRVKWDGRYVAGLSNVIGFEEYLEDENKSSFHKSLGHSKYEAIALERGVTYDLEFEEWVKKSLNLSASLGDEYPRRDFRKDITIELLNEAGEVAKAYNVFRCWVSEFQAMPELDGNTLSIQLMKLENEGWARDETVIKPLNSRY